MGYKNATIFIIKKKNKNNTFVISSQKYILFSYVHNNNTIFHESTFNYPISLRYLLVIILIKNVLRKKVKLKYIKHYSKHLNYERIWFISRHHIGVMVAFRIWNIFFDYIFKPYLTIYARSFSSLGKAKSFLLSVDSTAVVTAFPSEHAKASHYKCSELYYIAATDPHTHTHTHPTATSVHDTILRQIVQ